MANRNRRYLREKKRKQFTVLKKPDSVYNKTPIRVQDLFEIRRIAPNGIFQVGDDLFSKSYYLEEVNYNEKTYNEQVSFFGSWCRLLNTIDVYLYKITVFNKKRDMDIFRNNILYQHKNDEYDIMRDCYNDIIESKIVEGKNGIDQGKFFTITIKRTNYEEAKSAFNSLEQNLIKEFSGIGSGLIPLNANERLQILHDVFRIGEESNFDINISDYINRGMDWKNDIACGYVIFNEELSYMKTDKMYYRTLYIDPESYPEDDLSDDFYDSLSNISECSMITTDYVPIAKQATKKVLEDKYMAIQDKIRKQQKKRNKNRDFSSEISYPVQKENDEILEMLDDVNKNGQQMFWVSISILLMADSLEKLDEVTDSVNLIVENHSCYTNEYNLRQREAFNTILPTGVRQVDTMRSMFTRMAGILIPFKTKEIQMKERPFYYGVNKGSRNTILANRKYLINPNGFVFGVSGGGKSMTGAKLEMGSVFLNTDDDMIILDPTLEYIETTEAFHGTYYNIFPDTPHHLNPLDFDVKNLSEDNIKKVINELTTILCGIIEHAMKKEFRSGHNSIIGRCVKILCNNILTQPVDERKVPILSDFNDILVKQKERMAKDIALDMERFIDGTLDMFNRQTNINPNNRVIAYGIRDMDDDLESVAMLVILKNIKKRIIENFNRGVTTWLWADEFHVLMGKEYSRKFFIALWKMIRKLGGICTGITQNLVDVVFDDETSKLISNSEYTMLLRMGAGDKETILKTFEGKISEAHIAHIENALPGTGLIRFGNTVIPMDNQIEKTNPIYDIFNTNFYEKIEQKKAQERTLAYS